MTKILLISGNSDINQKINKIFNKSPYEYYETADEVLVTELVVKNMPDIIFIDQNLENHKKFDKIVKSHSENSIIIYIISSDNIDKDVIKSANAFITPDMSDELIISTLNINLRMKNSLEMLANSNKDLADSLYRLNAMYSTSSQFAGTLDKAKLLQYMAEGMDKALSYSLNCTLSLCTEDEPVLIINSLYELSDEIISALKLRTILNYKQIFSDKKMPFEIDIENLKVVKHVKNPSSRFTFNIFQYDNMSYQL